MEKGGKKKETARRVFWFKWSKVAHYTGEQGPSLNKPSSKGDPNRIPQPVIQKKKPPSDILVNNQDLLLGISGQNREILLSKRPPFLKGGVHIGEKGNLGRGDHSAKRHLRRLSNRAHFRHEGNGPRKGQGSFTNRESCRVGDINVKGKPSRTQRMGENMPL